jgi:hypothetical protein
MSTGRPARKADEGREFPELARSDDEEQAAAALQPPDDGEGEVIA